MTSLVGTARRLCLSWGLHCVATSEVDRFKTAVINSARTAVGQGFAKPTDQLVVTAGVPFGQSGTTNILRVAPCDERLIIPADPE